MALKLKLEHKNQRRKKIIQNIIANVGKIIERQHKSLPSGHNPYQYLMWMTTPPHTAAAV
jgi:hypothetical protein